MVGQEKSSSNANRTKTCLVESAPRGSVVGRPCGKSAIAECADCGFAVCKECSDACCGKTLCVACLSYHVKVACLRKHASSKRKSGPRPNPFPINCDGCRHPMSITYERWKISHTAKEGLRCPVCAFVNFYGKSDVLIALRRTYPASA